MDELPYVPKPLAFKEKTPLFALFKPCRSFKGLKMCE